MLTDLTKHNYEIEKMWKVKRVEDVEDSKGKI